MFRQSNFLSSLTRWQSVMLLVAVILGLPPAQAAEVDSFTDRQLPLRDARYALEARFNRALAAGVVEANRNDEGCDRETLYDSVQEALASPFIGHQIATDLDQDTGLDRLQVTREQSIYRDLGWLDNPSVHLKDLVALVRVGDTRLGVDKFGHFFVEGWSFFEKAFLKGKGIDDAIDWGEFTERTYFGNYTTGIYSYADLVANFEGMRFWLRLTGGSVDPIDDGWLANRPYVSCHRRFWLFGERRWYLSRKLRLADYVTPVWDEAVNCSAFRNSEIEAWVQQRIAGLGKATGVDYSCSMMPAACTAARQRYGDYAPHLLHPSCLAATGSHLPQ